MLLAGLFAGCGDDTSDASDPVPERTRPTAAASSMPTVDPSDGLEPQTIAIVAQTAVGGRTDLNAVPLGDAAARQEFAAQFNRPGMGRKIAQAVASATVPEGYTVMGAVVSISCDVPPGVAVSRSADGWVLKPRKVDSPLQECFAPVTSVAIVAVPA